MKSLNLYRMSSISEMYFFVVVVLFVGNDKSNCHRILALKCIVTMVKLSLCPSPKRGFIIRKKVFYFTAA